MNTEMNEDIEMRCEEAGDLVFRAREVASALAGRSAIDHGILMYAPGGKHKITPGAGNGAVEIAVDINPDTALVLNASLAVMNARMAPQKCFIDKEHEGKEATAWPKEFFWSETSPEGTRAPGVYCRCDLTALGKQLIEGKIFRAFSPSFTTDSGLKRKDVKPGQLLKIAAGKRGSDENPARINGVVAPDIGTLTNLPAFKEILPLFASERGGDLNKTAAGAVPLSGRTGNTGNDRMKKTDQELATLRARKSLLEQNIPTLKAKDLTDAANVAEAQNAEQELHAIDATLQAHEMATKNEQLESALLAQRSKDAKAAVEAAVKRGAIPAKNLELRARWEKDLTEDPSRMEILAAIPGAAALQTIAGGLPRLSINHGTMEHRASTSTVLRKMAELASAGQANEVAALYATEIRARYKEGDDMPLRAADVTDANLGVLAGTLVTQRTLELFRLQFDGLLTRISTDFSEVPAQFNQTTNTRIIVVPAVVSYDATIQADGLPKGFVQTTQAQTVDVPITLDQHKAVPVSIGVNLLAATARRLFDEQAPAAAYALIKDLIDNLYGKITPAAFNSYVGNVELGAGAGAGVVITDETAFDKRTIGIAGRVFNPQGVPLNDRFILLNSDYHDDLENDPTIIRLATYQQNQTAVITDGMLPRIKRFQPIEAPNLPVANNLVGFAGHKSSLAVQSRVPNDYTAILPAGATHGLVQTVTEPDSRLSAMIVWFADHMRATGNFRIAWMYGTAVGNKKGGLCYTHQ